MGQRGQAVAHAGLVVRVDLCHHHAGAAWQAIQHAAPRIHDHAVAVGFASVDVIAALRRGNHVGQVFNGAGAQQDFPVHLAGGFGKGGGQHDQVNIAHSAE